MVAGSSGGRGGGVAGIGGASRGASGIATRGGGIESGRGFSSGKSFGNTARFESSFSGKVFATAGRSAERSASPKISISRIGNIEHRSPASAPKIIGKSTPSRPDMLTDRFGPKLGRVGNVSPDSSRPGSSAFKNTAVLVRGRSEQQQSNTTKSKTGERFGRTVELKANGSIAKPDTHKAAAAVKETRSVFTRSESKPSGKPSEAKNIPHKEQHALYTRTRAYRAGEKVTPSRSWDGERSLYNRPPQVDVRTNGVGITRNGERRAIAKAQLMRPEHMKREAIRPDARISPVDTQKTQAKMNEFRNLVRQDPRWKGPVETLQKAAATEQQSEQVHFTRQQEKTQGQPMRNLSNRSVSHQETAQLLRKYRERFSTATLPAEVTQSLPKPDADTQKIQQYTEAKADIEQATRVMAAYQAVIETGKTTLTQKDAEQAVLKTLDTTLAKRQLKEVVLPDETAAKRVQSEGTTISLPDQRITPSDRDQEEKPDPQPISPSAPITETVPTVQPQTETAAGSITRKEPETAEESTVQVQGRVQITTQQQVLIKTQQKVRQDKETEEEQEEEPEEEEEMLEQSQTDEEDPKLQGLTTGVYQRDVFVDNQRREALISTARVIFQQNGGLPIDGAALVYYSGVSEQPEALKSPIVRGAQPDGYLSDMEATIAAKEFQNEEEVASITNKAIDTLPAVTIGHTPSVTEEDAMEVMSGRTYRNKYQPQAA